MRLFLAHSPADVNNYLSICRPVPLSARRSTRDACVWVPCVKPLARSHGLCKFTMEYKPIISNLLKLFWPQIFVNRAQRRRRRACMCHSYIRPDDAHQLLHCSSFCEQSTAAVPGTHRLCTAYVHAKPSVCDPAKRERIGVFTFKHKHTHTPAHHFHLLNALRAINFADLYADRKVHPMPPRRACAYPTRSSARPPVSCTSEWR